MAETALITGASGGLGQEFAKQLAARGFDVVLVGRDTAALETLAQEIRAAGRMARACAADLSHADGAQRLADSLARDGITVDLLVNNAGFGGFGAFSETDLRAETDMIAVNVTALTALTKLLLPGMLARKRGRILNVASTAAFQPGPFMAVYYATKAYVLSFSLALREELRGTGVTVTSLCPGPTRTGFAAAARLDKSHLFDSRVMDAAPVVRAGIAGCMRGKAEVIPGFTNRIGAFATRLCTRPFAASVARLVQRPR
jgi:short-subunit dehydrogenase